MAAVVAIVAISVGVIVVSILAYMAWGPKKERGLGAACGPVRPCSEIEVDGKKIQLVCDRRGSGQKCYLPERLAVGGTCKRGAECDSGKCNKGVCTGEGSACKLAINCGSTAKWDCIDGQCVQLTGGEAGEYGAPMCPSGFKYKQTLKGPMCAWNNRDDKCGCHNFDSQFDYSADGYKKGSGYTTTHKGLPRCCKGTNNCKLRDKASHCSSLAKFQVRAICDPQKYEQEPLKGKRGWRCKPLPAASNTEEFKNYAGAGAF